MGDNKQALVVTGPSLQLVGGQVRHIHVLRQIAQGLGLPFSFVTIGRRAGEGAGFTGVRRHLSDCLALWRATRRARGAHQRVCVHVNSSVQFASLVRDLALIWAARLAGAHSVLLQIHGCLLRDPQDGQTALRLLARFVCRQATEVVVLSSAQQQAIGCVAHVVPNGVLLQSDAAGREPADRVPPDRRLKLIYLGRLETEKGPDIALDTLGLLVESGQRATLTIAGDGPMQAELRARAAQVGAAKSSDVQVNFVGAVAPAQVSDLLIAHDMLLFPSRIPEGLPYVLLEAMEAALPVVATVSSPTVAQVVALAGDAIVTAEATAASFAAAVLRCAREPGELQRRGQMGRETVVRHYSVGALAPKWAHLWAESSDNGALR